MKQGLFKHYRLEELAPSHILIPPISYTIGDIKRWDISNEWLCLQILRKLTSNPGPLFHCCFAFWIVTSIRNLPAADVICEMGWKPFNKSCYKLSEDKTSWAAAKKGCGELGGYLLKIDDQTEQTFIKKEVKDIFSSVGKIC